MQVAVKTKKLRNQARNNAEKLLRDYILYDIDIKDPDGEDVE